MEGGIMILSSSPAHGDIDPHTLPSVNTLLLESIAFHVGNIE